MKEKPIIFNTQMVNGVQEGRKTNTRRLDGLDYINKHTEHHFFTGLEIKEEILYAVFFDKRYGFERRIASSFGKHNQRLWVRENFKVFHVHGISGPDDHIYPEAFVKYEDGEELLIPISFCNEYDIDEVAQAKRALKKKKSPSIHMPRWASRIDLLIKDIRVERLQDISEEDARAEGINLSDKNLPVSSISGNPIKSGFGHRIAFKGLWQSINGAGSWDENPWVWVVDFEKVKS